MLHRVLWEYRHGPIPPASAIVPVKGDWDNFSEDNWLCRPHAKNGREFEAVHHGQKFDGIMFRRIPETGYYGSKATGTTVYMQRYVWQKHMGPIPEGLVIHHIDFDKANNDIKNLGSYTSSDHTKLHARIKRMVEWSVARHKHRKTAV
ncbi:MAG: HNH endonuclease [Candidatus Peribacteraceae bacterium]|nr:HNH endonuclease [Candidatus Peribacteraceae bacterium]